MSDSPNTPERFANLLAAERTREELTPEMLEQSFAALSSKIAAGSGSDTGDTGAGGGGDAGAGGASSGANIGRSGSAGPEQASLEGSQPSLHALHIKSPRALTWGRAVPIGVIVAALSFGAGVMTGTTIERRSQISAMPTTAAPTALPESPEATAPTPHANTLVPAPALVDPRAEVSEVREPHPTEHGSRPAPAPSQPTLSTDAHAGGRVPPTSVALADERALVEGARTALLRNRPADALALAERHARAFPKGELAEDREFLAISALRDLGRREPLRARGEAFLRAYPSSALRVSVEQLLERARDEVDPEHAKGR
jgi:hypothetical protein